jgi:hypothetical protein
MSAFGRIFNSADIIYDPNKRSRLSSTKAMSLHTDNPLASTIVLYCETAALSGGESIVLDFKKIHRYLTEQQLNALKTIDIAIPPSSSKVSKRMTCKLIENGYIYYADWLILNPLNDKAYNALMALKRAIEKTEPHSLLLKKNEALFINNKRMLHGRRAFSDLGKSRTLKRYWIRP